MASRKPKLSHGSFPLMYIIWSDALVETGWEAATTKLSPSTIVSTGWLISQTDKALILASDIGDQVDDTTKVVTTETNRRIAIPKDWVISQKELK